MNYAELTFQDKNFIKRWLQRQRLVSAIKLSRKFTTLPNTIWVPRKIQIFFWEWQRDLKGSSLLKAAKWQLIEVPICDFQHSGQILDFGAGNGELCKLLSETYQGSQIICYEPSHTLLSEAKENLKAFTQIEFCQDISNLTPQTFDAVFCLEVFEHLPPEETIKALETIYDLLKSGGLLIIGVPIEIGIPALYKGLFRMSRRYGEFDADIKNIVNSFLMNPPQKRPISEIEPGLRFHYPHMGFDFRHLEREISTYFSLCDIWTSPFVLPFGSWLMPEIYFAVKKLR